MNKIVDEYYEKYNFPSVDKLYKYLKADNISVTKKEVDEYLLTLNEVQLTKETKIKKADDGHITAMFANQIWQIDIFILQKYVKYNHGYRDILCAIDVFTRKAYCVAMKNKDIDDCTMGLNTIIKKAGSTPMTIMSDNDASFKGGKFQKLLNKYKIAHDMNIVGDHHALGIVDRFARTLKTILTKTWLRNNKNNWVDYFEKIIDRYNDTPHTGILDIAPNDADEDENQFKLAEMNSELRKKQPKVIADLVAGDKVRINTQNDFSKGTEPKWSGQIYIVESSQGKRVVLTNKMIKKRDQLLKVHKDSVSKEDVVKKAKKEYKNELILKKEGIKPEDIRVGIRERKKKNILDL